MKCPMCGAALNGQRLTCSARCRQRKARARRAATLDTVQNLLDQQTEALSAGADPAIVESLAREAGRLMAFLSGR